MCGANGRSIYLRSTNAFEFLIRARMVAHAEKKSRAGRYLVGRYGTQSWRMSKRGVGQVGNNRSEYCFCSWRRTCGHEWCSCTRRCAKSQSTVSCRECRGRERLIRTRVPLRKRSRVSLRDGLRKSRAESRSRNLMIRINKKR